MWVRRGTGTYYYRHRRVRGRVLKIYVGAAGDPETERQAALDQERRARRLAGWQELRQTQARWHEAEAPLSHLVTLADQLSVAALYAAGFYQHQRGEWRCRRDQKQQEHRAGAS
jgi:hypothetical protein